MRATRVLASPDQFIFWRMDNVSVCNAQRHLAAQGLKAHVEQTDTQ